MSFMMFVLQSQKFDIQVYLKIVGVNSHFVQTEAIAVNEMYLFSYCLLRNFQFFFFFLNFRFVVNLPMIHYVQLAALKFG
jgi:hypothetical protein